MKKQSLLFIMLALLMAPLAAKAQQLLLQESFENMTSIPTEYSDDGLYACKNGNGYNWKLKGFAELAHSGTNCAMYEYNRIYDADCFLVSAPFNVSADMTSLNVSVYERTPEHNQYFEKFEVFFVKASDVTAETTFPDEVKYMAIAEASYNNNTGYEEQTGSVASELVSQLAGQSVRVVVHCTSPMDQGVLYIDDITVTQDRTEPYISLSPVSATIVTGQSGTTTLTATVGNVENPTITYTSSNTDVATVSGNGTTATVTAVGEGTATITASMTYNATEYTATSVITVMSYCRPTFTETDTYIKNFTLGTISNNNSGCLTGGYADYTNLSTTLETATEYTLSLTTVAKFNSRYQNAVIWIDFNDNCVFDDPSERVWGVYQGPYQGYWNETHTFTMTIPADAALGQHRLRLVFRYNYETINPCKSETHGECEDYMVNIVAATCSRPSQVAVSHIGNHSAQIDWTSVSESFAVKYRVAARSEWQTVNTTATTITLIGLDPEETYEVMIVPSCNETFESDIVSFTTNANKTFTTTGAWSKDSNWTPSGVPGADDDVIIEADATIPFYYTATANNITIATGGSITIKDGGVDECGQLIHKNEGVTATMEKIIHKYTVSEGEGLTNGWYFIASPLNTAVEPSNVTNMVSNTYDLYRFNQSADDEWQNYKAHTSGFVLENGKGYLYANNTDVTLQFTGTLKPYSEANGNNQVNISAGFNLVGNPFACKVYADRPYYKMNSAKTGVELVNEYWSNSINPLTGIVVEAASNRVVTFTKDAPEAPVTSNNSGSLQITLSQAVASAETPVTRGDASAAIDNAIITFNEGMQLGKFYFGEQSANLYLPNDDRELAIDFIEETTTEKAINLKVNTNGRYTLSFSLKNTEMSYLHLIDNMTGNDIDLLATPSYTFEAKSMDYASRFKLVFSNTEGDGPSTNSGTFAFISDGNLIVNGTGTLQLFDVMGRQLFSKQLSTENCQLSTPNTPGVYVLRLINGDSVRTQKIVVK